MNPIGAALLACAAAGCAWSAWVSLRGRWRVVVIILSAALAVLVPAVQLDGSTSTTERASSPPPEPAGGHEVAPAPTVEVPPGQAAPLSAVAEPAIETPVRPVPPVQAELAVAPLADETLPVAPDDVVELAAEETRPGSSDVQPPPEHRRDAVPQAVSTVAVPPAVETSTALRTAAETAAPSAPSSGSQPKKAARQHERPNKAKPEPKDQRRHH